MKAISRLLPCLFSIIVLFSSCLHREDNTPPKNPNTPNALRNDKISDVGSIYRSRGGDLVDEIYNELLEKRPELKSLENDIDAHRSAAHDSLSKYNRYEMRSVWFYQAANSQINSITDSALKTQMRDVIAQSQLRYKGKMADIDKMIAELGKKDTSLNNYHTVMKLMITLPVMEQFQNDELPDDKILHKVNADKQKLIDRTKALIPKVK